MALINTVEDPADRVRRLASSQEKKLAQVFLQAAALISDPFTLDELADLIAAGRFEEALKNVERAASLLGDTYAGALQEAAQQTAEWLNTNALSVVVSFDVVNASAVAAMESNRLRLIREIAASQRAAIRTAMAQGIARGLNPTQQARLFRDAIGLTESQMRAVDNYRRLLEEGDAAALLRANRDARFDPSVRAAASGQRPLTSEQIDRMVQRYRERSLRHRAEVIARTEALRATHEGRHEMYRQAVASGDILPDELERKWVSASDARVRSSHRRLSGTKIVGPDAVWQAEGGTLRFPGDPSGPGDEVIMCRCVETIRLAPIP